jgi:diguanylate cyclase (GGDEF)-like protein
VTLSQHLEAEYREARFHEYARISRNVAAAGGLLILALWVRDLLQAPDGAGETVVLRIIMAASALVYAAALRLQARRTLILASGYIAVFIIEGSLLTLWSRLDAGATASFPGFLYIYLILPLIMLPFSFRETVAAIVLVPVVPNLQALAGMAPGFPLAAFNAMIWPACAIALYANHQYERLLRRLFASQGKLKELATRDELTGLGNRRYLMERGAQLLGLARRHGRPFAVLMLDLDHFKAVNDRYGHAAGDDVLRFLGAAVTLQLRATDVAARSGGEEFVMLLPETRLSEAVATAERVRVAVASTPVPTDEAPEPIAIAVSIGVAALDASCASLEELLGRADAALYEAKRTGRNRVCAWEDPDGRGGTGLATGTDSPRR